MAATRACLLAALLLAACAKRESGSANPYGLANDAQQVVQNVESTPSAAEIPPYVPPPSLEEPAAAPVVGPQAAVTSEQIAYDYTLSYRLPSEKVLAALVAHRRQCAALGRACIVTGESRRIGEDGVPRAQLELRVDARQAAGFADRADAAVAEAGGQAAGRSIESENLTTNIIDTDARLRSKELLAQRLEALLRTRQGRVADLVEAERALAEARGDIDSARSQLAEMRRRVAQSGMTLDYRGIAAENSAVRTPLRDAVAGVGLTFAESLAALIGFVAALLPWLVILLPLGWLARRGWRALRDFRARRAARRGVTN